MACGVPVVGTDDFALKEYIISGKTGERFPMGDYEAFYVAVKKCIENYDLYSTTDFVRSCYSRESVVEGYQKFLSEYN